MEETEGSEFKVGDAVRVVARIDLRGTVARVARNGLVVGGFIYDVHFGEGIIKSFDCNGIEPVDEPVVWRERKGSQPPANDKDHVVHAEDEVDFTADFHLYVVHVDSFPRGAGFVPRVKGPKNGTFDGELVVGCSKRSYARAWEAGIPRMHQLQDQLDDLRGQQ